MATAEVNALRREGKLAPNRKIDLVFSNSRLNPEARAKNAFEAPPEVSDYARPRIVMPAPKAQASATPTTTPAGPVAPMPAVGPAVVPISADQVKAVVAGFFKDHPADDK